MITNQPRGEPWESGSRQGQKTFKTLGTGEMEAEGLLSASPCSPERLARWLPAALAGL